MTTRDIFPRTAHPTLVQVAAVAGVSLKTASRVFSGSAEVAPVTVRKVKLAAELVGYRSNLIARELRSKAPSKLIGMVISDLGNPFYAGMAAGAEEKLSESGFDFILATARDDGKRERTLIESLLERRVRGLIIVPSDRDYSYLHLERQRGLSLVFVDRPAPLLEADMVLVDNQGGIANAMEYLIDQGCRKIGLIADNRNIWTSEERVKGFQNFIANKRLNVKFFPVMSGIHNAEDAEKVARSLICEEDPLDGLIAANDLIAIGIGHAINASHSNIKVVSFDDFPFAKLMGITTLDHDSKRLGLLAAETLLSRISNPTNSPSRTKLMKVSVKKDLLNKAAING